MVIYCRLYNVYIDTLIYSALHKRVSDQVLAYKLKSYKLLNLFIKLKGIQNFFLKLLLNFAN